MSYTAFGRFRGRTYGIWFLGMTVIWDPWVCLVVYDLVMIDLWSMRVDL